MKLKELILATGLLTLFLITNPPLHAQESTGSIIKIKSTLPSLQKIISSLKSQNAPVPSELSELVELGEELETEDDMNEFEMRASRYFGEDWENRIQVDASSQAAPEAALFVRTRIYLSSLISHADEIASFSPLSAEEIRAYGTDLMQKSAEASDLSHKKFFEDFSGAYEEIFPEGNEDELDAFRNDVTILLADLADALSILTSGKTYESLQADLAELQSHLQLVSNSQQLTAWLARFDSFASKILEHTVPTDMKLLLQDVSALLSNLTSYLSELEKADVYIGKMLETVSDLEEELTTIETDEEFDDFLDDLEEILTNVTNPAL